MSIAGTVRRFANEPLTATRYGGFYDDGGRWKKRVEGTIEFMANVQPARPDELQRMPENYRKQGAFWIYPRTSVTLRTGTAAKTTTDPGTAADEVQINGETYEIAMVERWRRHTRYAAARHQQ